MRVFIMTGSIIMLLGVAFGAFGAHILEARIDSDMLEVYHTGVLYHLVHGVGLLVVGLAGRQLSAIKLVRWSGWLLVAGIVVFSGSLYILAISGVKILGAITPIGGVAFLAGWACLAAAAWKEKI